MKNFKIILMIMVFLSIQSLQATTTTTTGGTGAICINLKPETDDKVNPGLLNTLPAVNILNLSGVDCYGVVIQHFVIHTIPNANTGILYLADEQTEVTPGQYLSLEKTNKLRFDPNENFEGNATFTYCSVDARDSIDPSPATVTLPIVAPTSSHTVHNTDCGCKDYETSIPSLSKVGFFMMFMLSIFTGFFFMRKEI